MAGFMEWFLSKLRLIDDDEIEIEEEPSEDIIPWLEIVGKKKIKDVAYICCMCNNSFYYIEYILLFYKIK